MQVFKPPFFQCKSGGHDGSISCLKYQNFTLREDLDLTEVGGIVLSNIVGLEELRDAESLQYVPVNNTLWITDDDSHMCMRWICANQR